MVEPENFALDGGGHGAATEGLTGNLLRDAHALTGLESLKGGKHGRSVGKGAGLGERACSSAGSTLTRVHYVPPTRWPLALAGYAMAGLIPAALITPASALFVRMQIHPGAATAILVNLVLPLLFVATAVYYPRPLFALLGVPLALAAFTTERVIEMNPAFWQWSPGLFATRIHPIVTVGALISGAIAVATCFSTMPLRRVGVPPKPNACHNCGYDLGEEILQCPECGEARSRPTVRSERD